MLLFFGISVFGQTASVTDKTPSQEATQQTEKLQKELNLNEKQVKLIYTINLKYAKQRKETNTRKDALKRIKLKDDEILKVLNEEQKKEFIRNKKVVKYNQPFERRENRPVRKNWENSKE